MDTNKTEAVQPQAWDDTTATERLRSIVDVLGLQSEVPSGDLTGYEFAVLGTVRRAIERLKAAAPQPAQAALSDGQAWQVLSDLQGVDVIDTRGKTAITIETKQEAGECARAVLAASQQPVLNAERRAAIHRKVLAQGVDGPDVIGPTICTVPPSGWSCTRVAGHDGPCAAIPAASRQPDAAPVQAAVVYPPDGTVSPFTVINLGSGMVKMGDAVHDGRLPALWFGKNGLGMGVEEAMNRVAGDGETLAVVTFANVEGLDVLLEVVQRIRTVAFPSAPSPAPVQPADAAPSQAQATPVVDSPVGYFVKEGIAWVQTSSDDPRGVKFYAAQPSQAQQVAEAVPIYQVQHQACHDWSDVTEQIYRNWFPEHRRTVYTQPTAQAAPASQVRDERAEFEAWVRKTSKVPYEIAKTMHIPENSMAWMGWQARATLAAQTPAQQAAA